MSNPLISAITGRGRKSSTPVETVVLRENDVVPVPGGGLTRKTYRDRLAQMRHRRGEDADGNALPESLSGVLGEGNGDVIPDNADELDTTEIQGNITSRMTTVKDTVEEPGRPRDPDEIFISPKTALTAPDATPDNMTQLDPSKMPGVEKDSFTVPALEQTPEEGQPEVPTTNDQSDSATRTMDLLLGRKRVGSGTNKPEEFAAAGAVTSEAQAQVMLGIGKNGDALLGQGHEMPPPAVADPKAIYEAARRWV